MGTREEGTETAAKKWLPKRQWWFPLALVGLLLWGLWFRVTLIEGATPYTRHIDEYYWMKPAVHIIKTGDFNPHRFTKPSLMVYGATFGLALGLVRAGAHGEKVYRPSQLKENGGFPHHDSKTAIKTARVLFALLSLATLLLATLCVRKLTRSDGATLLALVLMLSSEEYLRLSWTYINVDILGCFFAMAAISYALLHDPRIKPIWVVLLCGVLSGLTLGSKYNLFWIAAPMLVFIGISYRKFRLELTMVFVAAMAAAFVFSSPYVLLDLPAALRDAAGEARHYALGHSRHSAPEGLSMLFLYLKEPWKNFGPMVMLLALGGLVMQWVRHPGQAAVVSLYPLLLLAYMAGQKTYFSRNLVVLQIFVPIWAACGSVELFRFSMRWAKRRFSRYSPQHLRTAVVAATVLVLVVSAPWATISSAHDLHVESRNEIEQWLLSHVPPQTTLLVADELEFDTRRLKETFRVRSYEAANASAKALRKKYGTAVVLVPSFEKKYERAHKKKILTTKKQKVMVRLGKNSVAMKPGSPHVASGDPKIAVLDWGVSPPR